MTKVKVARFPSLGTRQLQDAVALHSLNSRSDSGELCVAIAPPSVKGPLTAMKRMTAREARREALRRQAKQAKKYPAGGAGHGA